jgi:dUTP pyrophosphatase
MKMKIMKVRDGAILPAYQTTGAAGFDFHAAIEAPMTLKPGQHRAFPTGLSVEIPEGFELQIRPRSGLAYKYGVTMLNGVGTIDSDFRGEMKVLMVNWGDRDFVVEPAMRIAQGVVARYEKVDWVETYELEKTTRGVGGLGSTGE